jgi:hypothetical protein
MCEGGHPEPSGRRGQVVQNTLIFCFASANQQINSHSSFDNSGDTYRLLCPPLIVQGGQGGSIPQNQSLRECLRSFSLRSRNRARSGPLGVFHLLPFALTEKWRQIRVPPNIWPEPHAAAKKAKIFMALKISEGSESLGQAQKTITEFGILTEASSPS